MKLTGGSFNSISKASDNKLSSSVKWYSYNQSYN